MRSHSLRLCAALALALVSLLGCIAGASCSDPSCEGDDGNCYSCSGNSSCTTSPSGTCSAANHGTYCCTGGSSSTGSCGCGASLCNSNGYCCPRGTYGCGGRCYSDYNAALSAGCTTVKTCCP